MAEVGESVFHADEDGARSRDRDGLIERVLASSADCIKVLDLEGRLTYINASGCRLLEIESDAGLLSTAWTNFWEDDHKARAVEAIAAARGGKTPASYEAFAKTSRGTPKWWDVTVAPILGADRKPTRILVISRDVTERRLAGALLEAQNRALELVASGRSLNDVLAALARIVEEQAGGKSIASVFLVDRAKQCLRVGAAPSLPEEFNAAVDGILITPELGTCSDAAARNEVVITTDIATAAGWEGLSHLPHGLGLVAAWSHPIVGSKGEVLGTIGTYFRERRGPTEHEKRIVEGLCRTAALAIERRTTDEAARQHRDRMELVVRGAHVGIWYCPLPFGELIWDEKVKEHFHLGPDEPVTIETFFERIHPEDREATRSAIEHSIKHDTPYDLDYRTVSKDGRRQKWIRAMGRAYYDEKYTPIRFDGITIDVTARRHTEESLRESESRFRALADNITQLAWMTDETGWIFWYNKRWFDYTGTELVDMQGWGWTNVHHPDHVERVVASFSKAVAKGEAWEDVFPIRSRNGEFRWFLSRAVPIRDETGAIVHWFGTNTDIQDQRDSQESLRKHAAALSELNELNLAMSTATKTEEIVQKATDASTRLTKAAFGAFFYNVQDDRGESFMLYTISGVAKSEFEKFPMPRNTAVFAPTFRGEGVVRSDDITKDPRYGRNPPHHGQPKGHLPVKSYLAVPVMSRSGGVIGGLFFGHPDAGIFDEEAERHAVGVAAQAAIALDNARLYADLKRSEERYKLASRATNDAIWDWDLVGGRVNWSPAIHEIFGHADTEGGTTSDWWLERVHPEDRERIRADIHHNISDPNSGTWNAEYRFRRGDGRWADVLDRGTVLRSADGSALRMVGAMLDVSERKAAERVRQQLLESERTARATAERAGQLKDQFLATLSHELRTPLNAILGWSHLLRKGIKDPEKALRGVEVIERNARIQTQLISDLLDISRIVTGKMRLDVQRVELPTVIEAALESVRPAAEARGVRLQTAIEPITEPVYGDPARLQQVIWNLVSNGVKFTPKGGRVQIVLARVNSHVEIRVSDTGQGISPEFLPYMFERFRQADSSSAREHGGLGLGLALVKQLVEMHGGKVRAASDGLNQGATFVVELPLAIVHVMDEPEKAHPRAIKASPEITSADLRNLKVLVVDDEADALEMVRRVLEEYGASVRVATSAGDALEALQQERFDALLSDIGMPKRDGYELIMEARRRGYALPAAALTAFARSEDRTRALLSGYDAHVTKPVEASELLATVLSLTSRGRR